MLRRWQDAQPAERIFSVFTLTISILIIVIAILHLFGVFSFSTRLLIPFVAIPVFLDGVNARKRSIFISLFYITLAILFTILFFIKR